MNQKEHSGFPTYWKYYWETRYVIHYTCITTQNQFNFYYNYSKLTLGVTKNSSAGKRRFFYTEKQTAFVVSVSNDGSKGSA